MSLPPPQAHTLEEISAALREKRSGEKPPTVVFTNGVFDLPHPGHVQSLRDAKTLGDILIVAINSDDSVRRLKGPNRPIISEKERAKILASFEMVDFVVIFSEDTPLKVVQALKPDVIAKGEEYRGREVVGSDTVKAAGGRVSLLPMKHNLSTTAVVDRIVKAHQQAR